MEYAKILVNQVFIMFLLIMLGFILYKIKLISNQTNQQLTGIVLFVVIPAMIVDSYQIDFEANEAKNMLLGFVLSLISILIAILISHVLRIGADQKKLVTERFSVIFTNCGFMGIPLVYAIFGKLGVFYCNTYLTMFNLILWTYGVTLMKNRSGEKRNVRQVMKSFLSPTIICIALGLTMYFLKIKLPQPVAKATEYIASMNTPLAMIVSGVYIAQSNLLASIKKLRLYYVTLIKSFVIPLIVLAIFAFLPLDHTLLMTILVAAACPTASTAMLFANNYKQDVERASNLFTICTVFSIISIPIVILIAQTFVFTR